MPKSAQDVDVAEVATPADPITSTLEEFCVRLSLAVSSPELIAGFEYGERAAGRTSDTDAAYQARFEVFLTKPVV